MPLSQQKTKQGYILIAVLIILQVVSAIGLFLLSSSARQIKLLNDQRTGNHKVVIVESVLGQIEARILLDDLNCTIPVIDSAYLASLSQDWWGAHACSGEFKGINYYYVVEILGQYPCLRVNNTPQIAQYNRIALRVVPDKIKMSHTMVQTTFIKPVVSNEICQGQVRQLQAGRQMQRELK